MYRLISSQQCVHRIIRHVILFFGMVLLFSWVAYSRDGQGSGFLDIMFMVLVNAFVFFGYAYLTVYLLIPGILARKQYLLFAIAFIAGGIILSLVKFLLSDFVFYQAISPEDLLSRNELSLSAILVNTKDMSFIVALFAIVKFARDHYILESNIQEIKQKGLEAEIKLLEHQMDPHVIFNNFNNLYSISIYRPYYLQATVKKLKSVLHYLFRESRREKVRLIREVEMIENYIGLETLRYGARLHISFEREGDFRNLEIAPLILYPFVENCFVHGAGEDPLPSWIRVEVSVNEDKLRFYAANSVSERVECNLAGEKERTSENSVRRLEIQYPNSHRLSITDRQYEHAVELHLRLS